MVIWLSVIVSVNEIEKWSSANKYSLNIIVTSS